MKFNIEPGKFKESMMKIAVEEQGKYVTKKMVSKVNLIMECIRKNIQQVIIDYNVGVLDRYSGDFGNRLQDSMDSDRNMPLIDSGNYYNSISTVVNKSSRKQLMAEIYSNIDYAKYLENGTDRMDGYRVFEIALMRSRSEIDKILNSK